MSDEDKLLYVFRVFVVRCVGYRNVVIMLINTNWILNLYISQGYTALSTTTAKLYNAISISTYKLLFKLYCVFTY